MSSYRALLEKIAAVRRKWQLQALVKGISLFLASAVALLVLGVWGADLFGFTRPAVWTARVAILAAMAFVAARFLIAPLRRRISDVQIAQYIEERFPHLEDRLVAAVEFGGGARVPPGMLELVIKEALEKTNRIDLSVFVDRRRVARYGSLGAVAVVALVALVEWGPSFFGYGFDQLYVRWAEASVDPLMIQVVPGSIEVAKGTDQQIRAQLVGFDASDVRLVLKPAGASAANSHPMDPEPRGSGFLYLLVDAQTSLEYWVEAKGVRSPTYSLKVVDLPKVDRIDLTYHYPAYSGLPDKSVEGEGDISALKGTRVDVTATLSQPAATARLRFDDGGTLELQPAGKNLFRGTLDLRRSGSYVVHLASSGKEHAGSSEYQVEAIADAPPKVTITKPFRDLRATNVEEVFTEVRAEDDFGIGKLELRYSVNGAPEKSIPLFSGRGPKRASVTGTHTFFLEELGLQPGDVVSYFGRAWDRSPSGSPASSDIYFIEIRPFEQKYTRAQQGAGPAGGESAEENLSRQQKEIISATFKLIRDKERMEAKEYVESLKSLALVQGRLQATTQGLIERLRRRGGGDASGGFVKIAEHLKGAAAEMEKAALHLGEQKPTEALPEEQRALQQLMRAESVFREIQVSFDSSPNGGRGQQASAEDLADLFELELNKLKNQYETVQRGEQQARDQKLDEAMERLKELAKRQQQLNERNRMLGARGGSASSGGGQSQQQLMEQAEQLKRQLERLSRERSSPELGQVGSQLQRAIDEMKRALEREGRGGGRETAQGIRALDELEAARRTLARNQDAGLSRGVEAAAEESRQLAEEQKRIQEGIQRLSAGRPGQPAPEGAARRRELVERKSALADRVKGLGGRLEDLSRQARKGQRETSAKLADAAGTIRDKKLPERILQGNPLLESGYNELLKGREEFIRGNLEELARQVEAARGSLGSSREAKLEDAVNRSRALAEGLESLGERLRSAQTGQPGARGRPSGKGTEAGRSQQAPGRQGERGGGQPPGRGEPGAQAGSEQGQPGAQGSGGAEPGASAQAGAASRGQGEPGRQQTQGGAGGRPSGDIRGLSGNSFGPPVGAGGVADEDYRQLRREIQERLGDAQGLGRVLDRDPTRTRNLEQVIEALRRLDGARNYSDPEEVARLRAAITAMRQVELDLSRELAATSQREKYYSSDDNGAPAGYRRLVEEYYKALARTRSRRP